MPAFSRLKVRAPTPAFGERILDFGRGSCFLRDPRIAAIVRDALLHFDGVRFTMLSLTVMPTHVHALFTPAPGADLDGIIRSWKGSTGREANRVLGRSGAFWQADYFDRTIRDRAHLLRAVRYIENNPAAAGLRDWPWTRTFADRLG